MYLKLLACDLDGTIAEDGAVEAATWARLRKAKQQGLSLMLVTGRRLSTFATDGPYAELFEAIVAENGAAVYFPRNDSVILPFGRLAPEIWEHLTRREIPLERGMAIAATWVPHDEAVTCVLRETGGAATIEYNKGAVMVMPPGATKGAGLRVALNELGYSYHNLIACGDAENDRSLFDLSEMAVAVSNAVPEMKALADVVLEKEDGEGVRSFLDDLAHHRLPPPRMRPDRQLLIGESEEAGSIGLQAFHVLSGNLIVAGGTTSGKSHMAGLLAEALMSQGYQLCIIDPEGDYSGLRAFPHTLVLGGPGNPLPPVFEVVTLCEYTNVTLILDLTSHALDERSAYVHEILLALFGLRARRGRPHWFLIDEAYSFCPPAGSPLADLIEAEMDEGGLALVSYRLDLVAPALLQKAHTWLITRTTEPGEVAHLERLLGRSGCQALTPDALAALPVGEAFLCTREHDGQGPHLVRFHTARRVVPHVRHLHKYLRAPLPEHKRFYFRLQPGERGPWVAASLWDFKEALPRLSPQTLAFHLERHDFERWVRDVIHDAELARRLRKIRHRKPKPSALPDLLAEAVARRFEELESLI